MTNSRSLVAVVAALAASTAVSHAASSFRWFPGANSLLNASSNPIAANNATVLTYLSNDTTVNALSAVSGGGLVLQSSYGDDTFYKALANNLLGRYSTAYMNESDDSVVGKYVYAIVLDLPFSSFSTLAAVPVGTPLGISGIGKIASSTTTVAKLDITPPLPPQSFDGGNVQTTLQVIPEPAVAGLVALGAAVVAIRRYRARRRE